MGYPSPGARRDLPRMVWRIAHDDSADQRVRPNGVGVEAASRSAMASVTSRGAAKSAGGMLVPRASSIGPVTAKLCVLTIWGLLLDFGLRKATQSALVFTKCPFCKKLAPKLQEMLGFPDAPLGSTDQRNVKSRSYSRPNPWPASPPKLGSEAFCPDGQNAAASRSLGPLGPLTPTSPARRAAASRRRAGRATKHAREGTEDARGWRVGPEAVGCRRHRNGRGVVRHPVSTGGGRVHPPALPRLAAGRRFCMWRRARRLCQGVCRFALNKASPAKIW
jgi:hypothetical protein